MKSILYAGAALMIGASIYGFVDYKKSSNKLEFSRMYDSKTSHEVFTPVVMDETEPVVTTAVVTTSESKNATVTEKPVTTVKKTSTKAKAVKKYKKAKKLKLDYRSFSRAPMRDVVEMEEETKKADNQKQ